MKNKILIAGIMAIAVTGCSQKVFSEAEAAANRAVGAELVVRRCSAYIGGFEDAKQLRLQADKEIALAKVLGATNIMIEQARKDVNTRFSLSVGFTDVGTACNKFVSALAWHAS